MTSAPSSREPASSEGAAWLRGDSGAGTLLAVGLLVAVGLVALFAAGLAGAAVAQVRAQGAADLAALAAARSARDALATGQTMTGEAAACAIAENVARHNAAKTQQCVVDAKGAVTVDVVIATGWGDARGSARAGPRGTE
ncbi:pilus assembly protein TadG-related protein [Demequina aurantiaca]|uniref:pilus assembly protein TadG-related protein n=1 Tax=Demequina aurantiaca TaxID=676200 RepID=UPI0007808B29|nr:pilus assembly protein TadG-related protein [Demequina aurantiaca]